MVNNYRRGKYNKNKRYAKRTTEVKRKIAAYKKQNKRPVRNAMRPFVETKQREVGRDASHHIIFNNTTGNAEIPTGPSAHQMSVNSANIGTGANNAVPAGFTVIVPQSWSDVFQQGAARDQINGRMIYPTYLNLKVEFDASARSVQSTHEDPGHMIGLSNNYMCIKGWAKNSLIKSAQDEASLPTTSAAVSTQMAQIVAKCCQQSGINGDPLDFAKKNKDIVVQSHFRVKPNLNERYVQDIVATGEAGTHTGEATIFTLPKVMNFSWTIKRKQLLRQASSVAPFVLCDSWIPFVAFYNKDLRYTAASGKATADLSSSSKLYFTDQ